MKTLIHKKSKTVSEKMIDNADVKAFSGNEVMAMLYKLQATNAVQPTVSGIVSGIAVKPAKTLSKAPAKAKQLIVKLYSPKTGKHEEMSILASDACDLKLHELIDMIRSEGFDSANWSFKIRIPTGL